ncbi:hypothetical protein KIS4809_4433 [Bacillus sp. ZZV12-4809]|nr:hypothetical protein KIS4809_4433 [Bacillus sp. ZZV12-4809]
MIEKAWGISLELIFLHEKSEDNQNKKEAFSIRKEKRI